MRMCATILIHHNAGIVAFFHTIPTMGEKVESARAWFCHESGHKLQDLKARMQQDIKELHGVLTTAHGYNNKMQDGEQLFHIHDKTGRLMQQLPNQATPEVVMKGPTNLPVITSFAMGTMHAHQAISSCTTECMNTKKQMYHSYMKITIAMQCYIKKKPKQNGVHCPMTRFLETMHQNAQRCHFFAVTRLPLWHLR